MVLGVDWGEGGYVQSYLCVKLILDYVRLSWGCDNINNNIITLQIPGLTVP